ncbi:MAG: 2-polyprenylphenol 6-hydroxylase [Proteobacteria bacterium]|nr:2-polyprenylphenol 6-hydroxylase [Pseudomonadota bacterium]MDA1131843.1 2-polyprenylphenol 6-hydroxylase [Pseudomonadota bacterium]
MIRAVRNLGRAFAIVRILGRHGAAFVVDPLALPGPARWAFAVAAGKAAADAKDLRRGQRLAAAAQELGPSFIKLGQALSTRPDIVGDDVADDLSQLRDRLPPFAGSEARAMIEAQLEARVEEIFASFDDTPLAAASIAQVHAATLPGGGEVAVKVLRPGIEARFARDADFFQWVAEMLEWLRPDLRRLEPVKVVATFRAGIDAEMDLRLEAAAASELGEAFADDPDFRVPEIDWQRTQKRVMTAERVHGVPIGDRAALAAAGRDPDAVVRNVLTAFLRQAFRDGFFHADLHHGNLFVDENNAVIAVDFGIMGRLDKLTRRFVAELLLAFLAGDYRRAAEIHFEAGYVPRGKSVEEFAQACRSIGKPLFERPATDVSVARLLARLFEVTESFDMRTQPQLLLLQKTMMVVEGLCRSVAPHADLWGIADEVLRDWATKNLGVQARAMDAAEEFAGAMRRIPRLVEQAELAAGAIAGDGVRIHPAVDEAMRNVRDGPRATGRRSAIPVNTVLFAVIAVLAVVLLTQLFG